MPINHRVLSCGRDACLLRLRHWALDRAFFEVVDVQEIGTLEKLTEDNFDVVVICYSIPESEQDLLRKIVAGLWPHAGILTLEQPLRSSAYSRGVPIDRADQRGLLTKVMQKLERLSG